MLPISHGGYQFTFRKASNGVPARDNKIKRAEDQTEVFSIVGNFKKISEGKKIYVQLTFDGGTEEHKIGKWIEYKNIGENKDQLFYFGSRPLGKDATELKITVDVGGSVVGNFSYEID